MVLDVLNIGQMVRQTQDKIVIFGQYNYSFNVPRSEIDKTNR